MKKIKILIDNNYFLFGVAVSLVATVALVVWSEKYQGKSVLFEVLKGVACQT